MYAIQDVLIGFRAPFVMMSDEVAKREYKNFLEGNPNSKDMRLFKVGTFNEETGEVIAILPELMEGGN